LALGLAALVSGAACGGGDEGDGPEVDAEGLQMCCDLGAFCHPDPDDAVNSPKRACHTLGHGNDPAACRADYESCMDVCEGEPGEEPHFCG
jgi:hypothetical protein